MVTELPISGTVDSGKRRTLLKEQGSAGGRKGSLDSQEVQMCTGSQIWWC